MKTMVSICASFLVAFTIVSILPINGEETIYSDIIRLHVIANSDSDEDQSLKLQVRDEVLGMVDKLCTEAKCKDEAIEIINANIIDINKAAEEIVTQNGYEYEVETVIGKEKYPERKYDSFTLPSGEYFSLRVKIGDAEGKNWWCVLFPPMCTATATKQEEVFIEAGFTGEQYKIITETENTKYKIKFKLLEWLDEIF